MVGPDLEKDSLNRRTEKPRHETGDPWSKLARQKPNPFLPDASRELPTQWVFCEVELRLYGVLGSPHSRGSIRMDVPDSAYLQQGVITTTS
jgi:hypothetical protein